MNLIKDKRTVDNLIIPEVTFRELIQTIPIEAFRELFPGQRVTLEYLSRVGKDLVVEYWYRDQVRNARYNKRQFPEQDKCLI